MAILAIGCFFLSSAIAAIPFDGKPDDPALVAGQPAAQAANQPPDSGAIPGSLYPPPMTAKVKFHYFLKSIYKPTFIAISLTGSAINQANNTVPEWGQGWDAYGKRFGSSYGQKVLKRSFAFGLKTAFNEDLRYFSSGRSGIFHRSLYATERVFIARKDSGGTRPNYTGVASAFGVAYISRQWHPGSYHSWHNYLSSFAISLGLDAAKNFFNEFWPDIKQKLHF
jgi:hypothetical protein